jgi:sugar/nucleoside kinase (ribokinase family)
MGVICVDVLVRPVDTLPAPGGTSLVSHLDIQLGGLAAVTASVTSRLGAPSACIGRIGCDTFGDLALRAMNSHGVDTSAVVAGQEPTSATVVAVASDGERTFLHQPGANATLCVADAKPHSLDDARIFHWGGPGATPAIAADEMARLMASAQSRGIRTSVDTCFDPAGQWSTLLDPVLPHLDVVFSSIEEARRYTGAGHPEDMADYFLSHGASVAVIKLGAHGLLVKSQTETHAFAPHPVDAIDTTGAGDAACGGFLYAMLQGWPLKRCGEIANAVGAMTTLCAGGATGVRSLDHVLSFMESTPCPC